MARAADDLTAAQLALRSGKQLAGLDLLDIVKGRFRWSDHDIADALGVWPSTVSRYRVNGVPNDRIDDLEVLARRSPGDVDRPRRDAPKRGRSGLPGWQK